MREVRVSVPATAGNLGPGFDVLGLALTLHNEVRIACDRPRLQPDEAATRRALRALRLRLEVVGEGADSLPRGRSNLAFRAMRDAFVGLRRVPRHLVVTLVNRIPLARGLGSSAAATVGGLLAADAACGGHLSAQEVLRLAAKREGHPDNAAAALLGGLTAAVLTPQGPRARRLAVKDCYRAVVAVPDYDLPTAKARRALPARVTRSDAIFSLSRTVMLAGLLAAGGRDGLAEAMRDRLHQPYRAALLPGYEEALEAALRAGALGAALSGAGPSVLALVPRDDPPCVERVAAAMLAAYRRCGIAARAWGLRIDRKGARVRTP